MSSKGLYFCGESGCKGHKNFNETCSTVVATLATGEFPALKPFLDMSRSTGSMQAVNGVEEDTQPTPSVSDKSVNKGNVPGSVKRTYKEKSTSGKKKPHKDL